MFLFSIFCLFSILFLFHLRSAWPANPYFQCKCIMQSQRAILSALWHNLCRYFFKLLLLCVSIPHGTVCLALRDFIPSPKELMLNYWVTLNIGRLGFYVFILFLSLCSVWGFMVCLVLFYFIYFMPCICLYFIMLMFLKKGSFFCVVSYVCVCICVFSLVLFWMYVYYYLLLFVLFVSYNNRYT